MLSVLTKPATLAILLVIGAAHPAWAGADNTAGSYGSILAATETAAMDFPMELTLDAAANGSRLQPGATGSSGVTRAQLPRLPEANEEQAAFDWSILVCLAFGVTGLLWIRRRTAAL